VIAMTANAMEGDREHALASGMNDHISKPLNVDAMFATLARWIRPQASAPVMSPLPAPARVQPAELPECLDGIDIVAGLATCMGRHELYLRLLCKFRDAQVDFAEQFKAALAGPDASAAARLAHSLRGTAANIGAKAVAQAATALEQACHAGEPAPVVEQLASEVDRCLLPALTALAGLSTASTACAVEAIQDGPKLREQLNRLEELVAESDTAAMEALTELRNLPLAPALTKRLYLVAQQVEQFDFDRALYLLRAQELQ
jgi:HPt (histidine-containing phosphotransfer) domain-containing protein